MGFQFKKLTKLKCFGESRFVILFALHWCGNICVREYVIVLGLQFDVDRIKRISFNRFHDYVENRVGTACQIFVSALLIQIHTTD